MRRSFAASVILGFFLLLSYVLLPRPATSLEGAAGEPVLCAQARSCETPGDVNCDGVVDSADVDLLIVLLFCDPCPACPNQDVNGDGLVSAADIVALLRLLAEGTPTPTETPVPTETPTPTPGPDCCECPELEDLCADPSGGSCPEGCTEARGAGCVPGQGCQAFTPTPTLTPTPGPDCCECPGLEDLCAEPSGGSCPEGCTEARGAGCVPGQGCQPFTPTPTTTPTPSFTPEASPTPTHTPRPTRTPTFTPLGIPFVC
ncbi:MAG: hypothetical protein KatS3mg076_3155 [Candidatus Binatia bacterium]|nr:MAG: hypothetical protein KatS3mg076_3155 [Candidatus Binatia bacterium]